RQLAATLFFVSWRVCQPANPFAFLRPFPELSRPRELISCRSVRSHGGSCLVPQHGEGKRLPNSGSINNLTRKLPMKLQSLTIVSVGLLLGVAGTSMAQGSRPLNRPNLNR